MAGIITNTGKEKIIEVLFGDEESYLSLYLGLYKNSTNLNTNTVMADLELVTGNSYSVKELVKGDWTVIGSVATYVAQTFTPTDENWGDVYGYYVSNFAGDLLWFEKFNGSPFNMQDSSILTVTPKVKYKV